MAKRIDDQERAAIIAEFPSGKSCNAIARQFGRATTTISAIAKSVGHEFGQVNTTRARQIKTHYDEERRARIRMRHIEAVERLLDQMFAPAKLMKIGGKDNVFTEAQIDEPTFQDKRDLASSISNLMRTVLEMDRRDAGGDEARGVLGVLFGQIQAEAEVYDGPDSA